MKILRILVVAVAVISCSVQEPVDDKDESLDTLATAVKTELINQAPMDAAAIEVVEQNGVIYLRGYTETEADRQRMKSIARRAAGKHRIVNQIEVK